MKMRSIGNLNEKVYSRFEITQFPVSLYLGSNILRVSDFELKLLEFTFFSKFVEEKTSLCKKNRRLAYEFS